MKTRIQVTFSDGEISIIEFSLREPARIELVIRAWGLLWQRTVTKLQRTTEPAECFYDGRKRHLCRFDEPRSYHDRLGELIPLAIVIQERQREVAALRKQGCAAPEIARQLKMPVASVSKLLRPCAPLWCPVG